MAPTSLNILKEKRENLKNKFIKYKKFLKTLKIHELSGKDVKKIDKRLKRLNNNYENFEKIQSEIESRVTDQDDEEKERFIFETQYHALVGESKLLVDSHKEKPNQTSSSSNPNDNNANMINQLINQSMAQLWPPENEFNNEINNGNVPPGTVNHSIPPGMMINAFASPPGQINSTEVPTGAINTNTVGGPPGYINPTQIPPGMINANPSNVPPGTRVTNANEIPPGMINYPMVPWGANYGLPWGTNFFGYHPGTNSSATSTAGPINNGGNPSGISNTQIPPGLGANQTGMHLGQPMNNPNVFPYMLPQQMYKPQANLPSIDLPHFDGDFKSWAEFKDNFTALVDSNPVIGDVQRLQYLKKSLCPEALVTISTLKTEARNYQVAWKALVEQYERPQLIVLSHINIMLHYPPVVKESAAKSALKLRALYNTMHNNLEALRNLNEPVDQWNAILIAIISEKLDENSKQEWERSCLHGNERKTVKDLFNLIKTRCQFLESLSTRQALSGRDEKPFNRNKQRPRSGTTHTATVTKCCIVCKGEHPIYKCENILQKTPKERKAIAKSLQLCLNCLKANHTAMECTSHPCTKCNKGKHHALLHDDDFRWEKKAKVEWNKFSNKPAEKSHGYNNVQSHFPHNNKSSTETQAAQTQKTVTNLAEVTQANSAMGGSHSILPTAVVAIRDIDGNYADCRALLDPGSMSNFISNNLRKKLGLEGRPVDYKITGVGKAAASAKLTTSVIIKSKTSTYKSRPIPCLVLDKVTSSLPLGSFNRDNLQLPPDITLADRKFNIKSPIDLLLGVSESWSLLGTGELEIPGTNLIARDTKLGWVIGGKLSHFSILSKPKSVKVKTNSHTTVNEKIEGQLNKFWEVEEIEVSAEPTKAEQICESVFLSSLKRNEQGHFEVKVPFTDDLSKLGKSREQTLNRFRSLERKLQKNPDLKKNYVEFMEEYKNL